MSGTANLRENRHVDHAEVVELESRALEYETPCGAGSMIWHKWGQGSPLLLLHGGSGSWLHWLRTIPVLEQLHSVWVPDLPGMGDSDLPHEPYEAEAYAAVVYAGFESLVPGSEPIDVMGFSFGAGLATRIGCLMDGRFRHLVLSGANFYEPQPMGRRLNLQSVKRIDDPAARVQAVRNNLRVMMVHHDKNIDDLALHLYKTDILRRRLPRVAFSGFATLRGDLSRLKLQGRLSAISGADDQIIGHDAQGQAAQLRALWPDAQYHAIPGAGHWVMYEGAQGYNAALSRALAD